MTMTRWARGGRVAERSLAPLVFLAFIYAIYPYWDFFQFDADEGINLIKAGLVAEGYPLYTAIWSDQPPLLTYLLAGLFRLVGWRVGAARFGVACFSSLLLGSAWAFLRQVGGRLHAWLGATLVALLPYYLRLSISVMVGLPSIALGMVSVATLAAWHKSRRPAWLGLSALALGLAVLTKLMIGLLAPILAFGVVLEGEMPDERGGTGWRWRWRLGPALAWTLLVAAVVIGGFWLTAGPHAISQLLETHFEAPAEPELRDTHTLNRELGKSRLNLILGCLGIPWALYKRRWLVGYLVGWAAILYLFLATYTPTWYHHQLYISIPLAMLAAYALGEFATAILERLRARRVRAAALPAAPLVLLTVISLTTSWLPLPYDCTSLPPSHSKLYRQVPEADFRLEDVMRSYAPETRWVVTDVPMYAFRAGLLVPPQLAVLSGKRLATGEFERKELLEIFRRERPEQVLLTRFDWPALQPEIERGYRVAYADDENTLYVRSDLPVCEP
ncbi:MAG: glycosyltransferase family 39 protein [Anaerolineae bacterium]|nr:glycosyltransferase family 39 protein [Anaerolineae bacterium]